MTKADQHAELMRITPDLATKLLENNDHNRSLRQTHVDRLARTMRMGLWRLNGETIVIAEDGSILDGQHRLWAIMESGVTLDIWVIAGVDKDTFSTIDTGLSRSDQDHASIAKIKNSKIVSGAIQHVFRYLNGWATYSGRYRCTPTEMLELYYENPDIDESVEYGRHARKFLPETAGTAYHYIFSKISRTKANRFFDALATGEFDIGMSAVRALRERLIAAAMKQERRDKLDTLSKVAMTIKAWNAFYADKDIRVIRYAINEKFPKIKRVPKWLVERFKDRDPESKGMGKRKKG